MRPAERSAPEAGFTLIEALVALAILAIVSATVLQLASTGLDRAVRAGEDGRAASLAERVLQAYDADPDSPMSGTTEDGLTWTIERTRWVDTESTGDRPSFSDPSTSGFGGASTGQGDSGFGQSSSGFGQGESGFGAGDSGFGQGQSGSGQGEGGLGQGDAAGNGRAGAAAPVLTPSGSPRSSAPALFRVAVTVTDEDGRSVGFATLRLGRAR